MNDDTLKSLLARADRGVPLTGIDPASIRVRAQRRQAARPFIALALLCAVMLLVFITAHSRPFAPPTTPAPTLAVRPTHPDIPDQIALDAALQLARKHVDLSAADWPDPAAARESAAQTLLLSAQRTHQRGDTDRALHLLHETLALFPDTASAIDARNVLARGNWTGPQ